MTKRVAPPAVITGRPLDIVSIGGGPAGLYLGILMKKADPRHRVRVYERNKPDDTFGFGVVFSDATLSHLRAADPESYDEITAAFSHWDDIETHVHGEVFTSTGHGFSGLGRKSLLGILQRRAHALGVELEFEKNIEDPELVRREADVVLGADGVNSLVRTRYAATLRPEVGLRKNRFVWLGTTREFPAFTFYFRKNEHGLFRVHAYQYSKLPETEGGPRSTFIVECTEETWQRSGLHEGDEDATLAYCEKLFAKELDGHPLVKNRSIWRAFPTVRLGRWRHENVVMLGDAVHTAHFSIGSGTKLALEDSIALAEALRSPKFLEDHDVGAALDAYEASRRPQVESVQRAAQVSMEWFEETERYFDRLTPLQFTFSMLTRSLRITHETLRQRDPKLMEQVDRAFEAAANAQSGASAESSKKPVPPMFTPFKLRGLVLENRIVVSPMCQYSADDGLVDDWHLVHLGSRALGGAGLVMTEMTDVSREGRITPGCAGLYAPEHVVAWKRVVDFVHANSAAKIGVQLAHAGRKGSTKKLWEGVDDPLPSGNWPLIAPSALPYKVGSQVPKPMDRADMDRVRHDFVRATELATSAGFDLLELHCAHGYLLGTFLSPLTNQRTDEYGGSLEARLRYPLEIFAAVRAVWAENKPISVRISAHDWSDGGVLPEDAVAIAKAFREAGADIIDVSAGQTVADEKPVYGRLFQTPFADRIRLEANVPTMTVGNISSWADVNAILAAGRADLCVLARAHLYDPYWTRHAAYEQGYALPWPLQYQSTKSFTPH